MLHGRPLKMVDSNSAVLGVIDLKCDVVATHGLHDAYALSARSNESAQAIHSADTLGRRTNSTHGITSWRDEPVDRNRPWTARGLLCDPGHRAVGLSDQRLRRAGTGLLWGDVGARACIVDATGLACIRHDATECVVEQLDGATVRGGGVAATYRDVGQSTVEGHNGRL